MQIQPQQTEPLVTSLSVNEIEILWPVIKPHIERVLKRNKRFTPEDIKTLLLTKKAQLWQYDDFKSVLVTEIVIYPRSKVLNMFLMAGEYKEGLINPIEKWAKSIGCTEIEETGRRGWARMLKGYKQESVIMRKTL